MEKILRALYSKIISRITIPKRLAKGRAMQTNSDRLRLYIIDDSSLVRERLRALLSEVEGVEIVGEAGDADQAMKDMGELRPDAITLDIHLPGPNGFVVLQRLRRQWPRFVQAPIVIVLSNYPHDAYRRKALGMGANFFYDKSTEFEKVRDVLQVMAQPLCVTPEKMSPSPFSALTADLLRAHPFAVS
jgi:DNA-binding NarL/FixJ family response regulator